MSNDIFSTFSEDSERFEMPDEAQREFRPPSGTSSGTEDMFTTFTEQPREDVDSSGLRPGDLLDKRFELTKIIGSGAMGEVWLAHELLTTGEHSRDVVVKVVPQHIRNREEETERVRATFKTIERLSHTQICPIYYLGCDDRFGYFLVMKYIIGQNLSEFTVDYRKRNKKQPALADLVPMLKQIASALDYAHSKGVLHRDIKPQNIFYSEEDGAQLIDFGLAEAMSSGTKNDGGSVSGTIVYMSPEQLQGLPQDGRADQYSFAATVYEMLTGQPPFVASTNDLLLDRIFHDEIMPVRDVADCVNAALVRSLAKDRNGRFNNCTEFVEAIGEGADAVVQKSSSRIKKAPQPAAPGVESLMKRGHLYLEDSDWKSANDYFDRVLDIDPEYAPAYVGLLCAELKVNGEQRLGTCVELISRYANFQKAVRFADDEYKVKVEGYEKKIRERLQLEQNRRAEQKRKDDERLAAINAQRRKEEYIRLGGNLKTASTEEDWQKLAEGFKAIKEYKNSAELSQQCGDRYARLKEQREENERRIQRLVEQQRLEEQRRREQYAQLVREWSKASTEDDWLKLAGRFRQMIDYEDSADMARRCEEKIREAKANRREQDKTELQRQWREMLGKTKTVMRLGWSSCIVVLCYLFCIVFGAAVGNICCLTILNDPTDNSLGIAGAVICGFVGILYGSTGSYGRLNTYSGGCGGCVIGFVATAILVNLVSICSSSAFTMIGYVVGAIGGCFLASAFLCWIKRWGMI